MINHRSQIQKKKYKPFSNFVNIIPGDTVKMYPVLEANYGEVKLTIDGKKLENNENTFKVLKFFKVF